MALDPESSGVASRNLVGCEQTLGHGEGGSGVRETKCIWIVGGLGSGEVGRLFHFSACPSISLGFIAMKIAPVLINKPLLRAAMGSLLTPSPVRARGAVVAAVHIISATMSLQKH